MSQQQNALAAHLQELKTQLATERRDDLVRVIDEAIASGSTSLEIHYRLLGTLQQMRPDLAGSAEASTLAANLIGDIERALFRNA